MKVFGDQNSVPVPTVGTYVYYHLIIIFDREPVSGI